MAVKVKPPIIRVALQIGRHFSTIHFRCANRTSYSHSRNTFYRLKVDDPSGVKEEETNDLLGDDSNARLSANV